MTNQNSNRHPVDQLADIRAEMKSLKKREDEVKSLISDEMGNRDSLGGDQFIALQKLETRKGSIDAKKLAENGIDVDAYRKAPVTVFKLTTEPRVMEKA